MTYAPFNMILDGKRIYVQMRHKAADDQRFIGVIEVDLNGNVQIGHIEKGDHHPMMPQPKRSKP